MIFQASGRERPRLCDSEIIELYWARDERAIEETDLKYGNYLTSAVHNILSDMRDCEECINDTYIGAWNAMPPSRPNVLKAFLLTIARRVAINRYHSNTKKSNIPSEMEISLSELENVTAIGRSLDDELDAERLGSIISNFVRSLPERKRLIFMCRYYSYEPIDSIARLLHLSRSSVNKELAAIRESLRKKLESEGYSV